MIEEKEKGKCGSGSCGGGRSERNGEALEATQTLPPIRANNFSLVLALIGVFLLRLPGTI